MAPRPDIALVSLGTTPGLRYADASFAQLVRDAGASCEVVEARIGRAAGRLRRGMALTDLVEALAARRAARALGPDAARAAVYSTVTAALLQTPRGPYAVRFDSLAALNRPGAGGSWQRARERRVLGGAALLLPWSEPAARAAEALVASVQPECRPRIVVLPPPVEERPAQPPAAGTGDAPFAVAYAGNPEKRGLDLLCAAWASSGPPGARLMVAGIDRERALRWLRRRGAAEPEDVEWAGVLPRERWLEAVARARVLVNASRREDFGLAQLEALSAGTPLVTVPSPGAYEALALARRLGEPELVAADVSEDALAAVLAAGLALGDDRRAAYAARARELLAPYRPERVRERLAREALPALGLAGEAAEAARR